MAKDTTNIDTLRRLSSNICNGANAIRRNTERMRGFVEAQDKESALDYLDQLKTDCEILDGQIKSLESELQH